MINTTFLNHDGSCITVHNFYVHTCYSTNRLSVCNRLQKIVEQSLRFIEMLNNNQTTKHQTYESVKNLNIIIQHYSHEIQYVREKQVFCEGHLDHLIRIHQNLAGCLVRSKHCDLADVSIQMKEGGHPLAPDYKIILEGLPFRVSRHCHPILLTAFIIVVIGFAYFSLMTSPSERGI